MLTPRLAAALLTALTGCTAGALSLVENADDMAPALAPGFAACLAFAETGQANVDALKEAGFVQSQAPEATQHYRSPQSPSVRVTVDPDFGLCTVATDPVLSLNALMQMLTQSLRAEGYERSGQVDNARLYSKDGRTIRIIPRELRREFSAIYLR